MSRPYINNDFKAQIQFCAFFVYGRIIVVKIRENFNKYTLNNVLMTLIIV